MRTIPTTPGRGVPSWEKAIQPFRDGALERKHWADDFLARMKDIDRADADRPDPLPHA
jgi:hypothetical protein